MRKFKVRAFTILEVTISMLIAALVIGITYTAYNVINKSYMDYNAKHQEMAVLIRLNQLLKKDFRQAEIIEKSDSGLIMKNDTTTITYVLNPGFIVRTSGIIDTFKVTSQQVNILFEGKPVSTDATDEEQKRTDELDLTILFEKEVFSYHYFKQYSSVNLFERKTDAIN